jgi:hypothetical protein
MTQLAVLGFVLVKLRLLVLIFLSLLVVVVAAALLHQVMALAVVALADIGHLLEHLAVVLVLNLH